MSKDVMRRDGLSVVLICVVACAVTLMSHGEESESANVSRHLGVVGRVNLGSFYTPAKYVRLVGDWLKARGIGKGWTIADLSCGYGAFFELSQVYGLHECRYLGNDIDKDAIAKARTLFHNVSWTERNALFEVSRQGFGIQEDEKLIVVGNPPYNDVTSQVNQKIKNEKLPIDKDIKTRDLGMSSLLAYDKIKAEYVAVLHPLSYLVKKSNFSAARRFFGNYKLLEHVVFSSQEFAGTSKVSGFPVIVALYQRSVGKGLDYDTVVQTWFKTIEGREFSLSGFDYVTDEIDKYPGEKRYEPELLFYTMRDINALRRSRTFIRERMTNAVDVNPDKLAYYCYVDCFKRYAVTPYWMGNFNIPFVRLEFPAISNDVVAISKHLHPEIFGENAIPNEAAVLRVKAYIEKSIQGKEKDKCKRTKQKSSMVQQEFSSIFH